MNFDPVDEAKTLMMMNALYDSAFKIACMQKALLRAYEDAGMDINIALHFVDKWMASIKERGLDKSINEVKK